MRKTAVTLNISTLVIHHNHSTTIDKKLLSVNYFLEMKFHKTESEKHFN